MKQIGKIIGWLVCLLLAGTTLVSAEVVRLKSGKTIEGTILFQNDEVIVIRDASGARFQYPKSEIEEEGEQDKEQAPKGLTKNKEQRLTDSLTASDSLSLSQGKSIEKNTLGGKSETTEAVNMEKKVAMGISVFGGGMAMPTQMMGNNTSPEMGGHAGAEVMIGTSNMFGRRIFLGGSVGFQAFMPNAQMLSFIPIKLRAEVPLMLKRHAPMLGMGVGYGIGLQNVKGGFCADVEFGWRYSYSRKGAFFMGVFTDFQGAEVKLTETVSGKEYTSTAYRNMCGFGAKMALYF